MPATSLDNAWWWSQQAILFIVFLKQTMEYFQLKWERVTRRSIPPWNNHNRLRWAHVSSFFSIILLSVAFFVSSFIIVRLMPLQFSSCRHSREMINRTMDQSADRKMSTNKWIDKLCPIIINYVGARNNTFLRLSCVFCTIFIAIN